MDQGDNSNNYSIPCRQDICGKQISCLVHLNFDIFWISKTIDWFLRSCAALIFDVEAKLLGRQDKRPSGLPFAFFNLDLY
jgi:hypothetical protein